MSHFLQNLIKRHQGVGTSHNENQFVQPRPKTKFETDTRPAFFAQNDFDNSYDFKANIQSDMDVESYSSADDKKLKPAFSTEGSLPLQNTQVSPLLNAEKPASQPDVNLHINPLNERTNPVSRPLVAEKNFVDETSLHSTVSENIKPTSFLDKSSENTTRINHQQSVSLDEINQQIQKSLQHLNGQQLQHTDNKSVNKTQFESVSNTEDKEATSETNHRIQKILHRLNSQHTQHEDGRRTNGLLSDSASDAGNNAAVNEANQRIQKMFQRLDSDRHQHVDDHRENKYKHETTLDIVDNALNNKSQLPSFIEPSSETVEPVIKVIKQNEESQAAQRESRQQGLLQTPGWLTDMQASLNNRLQQISAKTELEPIINVSIGRIEIKAVQAESAKQPKTRKKPTGVMGLDDYLKQREGRGRA